MSIISTLHDVRCFLLAVYCAHYIFTTLHFRISLLLITLAGWALIMKLTTWTYLSIGAISLIYIQTVQEKQNDLYVYDRTKDVTYRRAFTLEERMVLGPKLMASLVNRVTRMLYVNQLLYVEMFVRKNFNVMAHLAPMAELFTLGNRIEEEREELANVLFVYSKFVVR